MNLYLLKYLPARAIKHFKISIRILDVLKSGVEFTRTRLDDPVIGETFNVTCRVSLYNFTRKIVWFWTDTKGVTVPISAGMLPEGSLTFPQIKQNQHRRYNMLMLLSKGAVLLFPNRTYSYSEGLMWSDIPKEASGTYTCQATWLNNSSQLNTSTTLNVRSIIYRNKEWLCRS